MVTIDLQNKAQEPGKSSHGYYVIEADYEESNLFRKFVHVPTAQISEDKITIQNRERKLEVIVDKKEEGGDNVYTFEVLFLALDLENPLIIIIESESESKFFRYSDLMGEGKPGSKRLSEIEDYHEEVSILDPLYNESIKAGTVLVYRLEKKKNYTGVQVHREDEDSEYRVYVHTPDDLCKDRSSCVSYNNKLVLTYIDDKHETGALYPIQEKPYERIKVYNHGNMDEGNLIQFDCEGKSFSYEKTEEGKWKYREGHKLEEEEAEESEDEETEDSFQPENSENRLSSDNKARGWEDATEATRESDSAEDIPDFLRGSFEPTNYTEDMIKNMDRGEDDHDGRLPDDHKQGHIEDATKGASGPENKSLIGKNTGKTIDEGAFEHDNGAQALTGTLIPVTIAVLACPAYMAYEYYLKR
nr:hypothetical protein MACL_00003001 [Theileria orientalis]